MRRFMYVSIDEAGSHVKVKHFRLLIEVQSSAGQELLGSACSQPIRVLANNDCPTGAADIHVTVPIR